MAGTETGGLFLDGRPAGAGGGGLLELRAAGGAEASSPGALERDGPPARRSGGAAAVDGIPAPAAAPHPSKDVLHLFLYSGGNPGEVLLPAVRLAQVAAGHLPLPPFRPIRGKQAFGYAAARPGAPKSGVVVLHGLRTGGVLPRGPIGTRPSTSPSPWRSSGGEEAGAVHELRRGARARRSPAGTAARRRARGLDARHVRRVLPGRPGPAGRRSCSGSAPAPVMATRSRRPRLRPRDIERLTNAPATAGVINLAAAGEVADGLLLATAGDGRPIGLTALEAADLLRPMVTDGVRALMVHIDLPVTPQLRTFAGKVGRLLGVVGGLAVRGTGQTQEMTAPAADDELVLVLSGRTPQEVLESGLPATEPTIAIPPPGAGSTPDDALRELLAGAAPPQGEASSGQDDPRFVYVADRTPAAAGEARPVPIGADRFVAAMSVSLSGGAMRITGPFRSGPAATQMPAGGRPGLPGRLAGVPLARTAEAGEDTLLLLSGPRAGRLPGFDARRRRRDRPGSSSSWPI